MHLARHHLRGASAGRGWEGTRAPARGRAARRVGASRARSSQLTSGRGSTWVSQPPVKPGVDSYPPSWALPSTTTASRPRRSETHPSPLSSAYRSSSARRSIGARLPGARARSRAPPTPPGGARRGRPSARCGPEASSIRLGGPSSLRRRAANARRVVVSPICRCAWATTWRWRPVTGSRRVTRASGGRRWWCAPGQRRCGGSAGGLVARWTGERGAGPAGRPSPRPKPRRDGHDHTMAVRDRRD